MNAEQPTTALKIFINLGPSDIETSTFSMILPYLAAKFACRLRKTLRSVSSLPLQYSKVVLTAREYSKATRRCWTRKGNVALEECNNPGPIMVRYTTVATMPSYIPSECRSGGHSQLLPQSRTRMISLGAHVCVGIRNLSSCRFLNLNIGWVWQRHISFAA